MSNNNTFIEVIEKYFTIFFYGSSIFIICLIVQGIILTLANIFFLPWVLLSCLISFAVALLFLKKTRQNIQTLPKLSIPIILFTSIVLSIMIFFPHDTIGGRDESAYSNMAVYLAQKGTLNLPEHLNNLPGNYAEGLRSRLPAYTVWLGLIYKLFGINGLFRSNVLLIMLGLFSFFLTASYISNRRVAWLSAVLLASSMPFLWFMRETMTENLFFSVLWFSILSLITYIKSKNTFFLIIVFFGSLILSLMRIEGLFIQATFSIVIITYTIKTKKNNLLLIITSCVILATTSLLVIKLFGFSNYFLDNLEGAQSSLEQEISIIASNVNESQSQFKTLLLQSKETFLYRRMPEFSLAMLHKYNLLLILLSIIIVVFIPFTNYKHRYQKIFYLLIVFIILPEFYKIISPSVTLDQPWFYRRYLYALLPLGYLSLVILLSNVSRWMSTLIIVLLFITNIIFSNNILFLKNNWTLTDKLGELSKDISKNDLIMIRSWTLGYYYPATYFIIHEGIRSVFLSGIELSMLDTVNKIHNGYPYNRLFMLSTNKNEKYPDLVVNTVKNIDLSYDQLQPLCQLYEIGLLEKYKNIYDINLIPYNLAVSHCAATYNTIKNHNETLYLYELTSR